MSFYERHKPVILGTVLAIVLVSLSLGLAYLVTYGLPLSDRFSAMQLFLSTVAFAGIFIALMVAIAQFRKSMAKPQLKLFFSKDNNEFGEDSKTSMEVNVYKDKYREVQLYLWIKNIGNSVATTFQIDIEVPSIFDPTNFNTKQGNLPSKLTDNGNIRIYTRYNTKKICFVNKPEYIDDSIILGLHSDKYDKYKNEYDIHYRVFGDWAETQEGKLKVNINKL